LEFFFLDDEDDDKYDKYWILGKMMYNSKDIVSQPVLGGGFNVYLKDGKALGFTPRLKFTSFFR